MLNLGRLLFAATCLSGACQYALAQESEQLVLPPHPGWGTWKVITNQKTSQFSFVERIPETQDVGSLKDMVVEQAYSGVPLHITPEMFLKGFLQRVVPACENIRVNGPKAAVERGFPVAYSQFYCTRQKGMPYGVVSFQKVIKGRTKLYIVQREWRLPAFKFENTGGTFGLISGDAFPTLKDSLAFFDSTQESNDYLVNSVFLCSSIDQAQPCPQ